MCLIFLAIFCRFTQPSKCKDLCPGAATAVFAITHAFNITRWPRRAVKLRKIPRVQIGGPKKVWQNNIGGWTEHFTSQKNKERILSGNLSMVFWSAQKHCSTMKSCSIFSTLNFFFAFSSLKSAWSSSSSCRSSAGFHPERWAEQGQYGTMHPRNISKHLNPMRSRSLWGLIPRIRREEGLLELLPRSSK